MRVILTIVLFLILIPTSPKAQVLLMNRAKQQVLTHSEVIDAVTFHFHYTENKKNYLAKTIKILRKYTPKLHQYFNYRPQQDVHMVINHHSDLANGFATVFPRNVVVLFDYPPLDWQYLNSSSDWITLLVMHEYTHILTIDMTHGYIDGLRSLFGSWVKPNILLPRWITEGVAVWVESRLLADGGRLNHPQVTQEVVQKLNAGPPFCTEISCLDTPGSHPFGNYAYWVGGFFLDYLENKYPGKLACLFKETSKQMPFTAYWQFKDCYQQDPHLLFEEFRVSFIQKHKKLLNSCPLSASKCAQIVKGGLLNQIVWENGRCEIEGKSIISFNKQKSNQSLTTTHQLAFVNDGAITVRDYNYPILRIEQGEDACWLHQAKAVFPLLVDRVSLLKSDGSTIEYPKLERAEKVIGKQGNYLAKQYKDGAYFVGKKKVEETLAPPSLNTQSDTGYSALKYFIRPTHWFFNLASNEHYNAFTLSTTLSDPINRHSLTTDLQMVDFHRNEFQFTPRLGYRYTNGSWTMGLGYERSIGDKYNHYEYHLNDTYKFDFLRITDLTSWQFYYGPQLSRVVQQDELGDRKSHQAGVQFTFLHADPKIHALFDRAQGHFKISKFESEERDDFYGEVAKLSFSSLIAETLRHDLRMQVAHHDKEDSLGHLYRGGGQNDFGLIGVDHLVVESFYPNTLYGNDLYSISSDWHWNAFAVFNGNGFWPFYLKGMDFIAGVDYGYADILDLSYRDDGREYYYKEHFMAIRYGISFKTMLFYLAPVDIDIYLAQLTSPTEEVSSFLKLGASFQLSL